MYRLRVVEYYCLLHVRLLAFAELDGEEQAQKSTKDRSERTGQRPLLPPPVPVQRNDQCSQPSAGHRVHAHFHASVLVVVAAVVLNEDAEKKGERIGVLNEEQRGRDAKARHEHTEYERAEELFIDASAKGHCDQVNNRHREEKLCGCGEQNDGLLLGGVLRVSVFEHLLRVNDQEVNRKKCVESDVEVRMDGWTDGSVACYTAEARFTKTSSVKKIQFFLQLLLELRIFALLDFFDFIDDVLFAGFLFFDSLLNEWI